MDDQIIPNCAIKEKNIDKLNQICSQIICRNLSIEEADLDKLQEYIYNVHSNDLNIQYQGLNRCRKLMNNPQLTFPRDQLIEILPQNNFQITIFQIAINSKVQLLQYETLWIIYNIVCVTQQEM
ncbi:unnamed protein product [Paramecium octaurelia]|uniref:Uncharacterized protein n=1 Tax=Paramecium octaurelia TaxID=43137 RepID=A0A8S1X5Z6_PAROT|nr:unnamed protein product [Paramecium octaurelia]